jgi:hypothetical protein
MLSAHALTWNDTAGSAVLMTKNDITPDVIAMHSREGGSKQCFLNREIIEFEYINSACDVESI